MRNMDIRYPDMNNTENTVNSSLGRGDNDDYNNHNLYNIYNNDDSKYDYFQLYKINNSIYNNTCINVVSQVNILKNSNPNDYSYQNSMNFFTFFIISFLIWHIYLFLVKNFTDILTRSYGSR
jgi:hypothetical protein